MALIKCVKCGELYSSNLSTCPHCNFTPATFVCPECGTALNGRPKTCWYCGSSFDSKSLAPADDSLIQATYEKAISLFNSATTIREWERVEEAFTAISGSLDVKEYLDKCKASIQDIRLQEKRAQEYQNLLGLIEEAPNQTTLSNYLNTLEKYLDLEGAQEVKANTYARWQEMAYAEACKSSNPGKAKLLFDLLGDYRDSKVRSLQCAQKDEARKRTIKKNATIGGIVAIVAAVVLITVFGFVIPHKAYNQGVAAYEAKDYGKAIEYFEKARGIKDSRELISNCYYEEGLAAYEAKEYYNAIRYFEQSQHEDAAEQINKCHYKYALSLIRNKKYTEAKEEFDKCSEYKDAAQYSHYCSGLSLFYTDKDYDSARSEFKKAGAVKGAKTMVYSCDFIDAESYYQKGELREARARFRKIPASFKYKGTSVQSRMNTLKKYDRYVRLCGTYHSTGGSMEVRQTHKSTGSWNNWSRKSPYGELSLTCKILKNGKVVIMGQASFPIYTEYSGIQSIVSENERNNTVNIKRTVSSLPNGLKVGDYTKMTVSGNKVKIRYYKYDKNENQWFNYLYRTDITYTHD